MAALNYHHLRYFRAIAHSGTLSGAAARLHVTQSSLSIQLRQLEERLGCALFDRVGRRLALTEAGRIALDYADTIFRTGEELTAVLAGRAGPARRVLRVGSVATLSRNFQLAALRPLLARPDVELVLHSGTPRELLAQLAAHTIDVVLSNVSAPRDTGSGWHSHLLAQQRVSLVGRPGAVRGRLQFPHALRAAPLILPGAGSALRAGFDILLQQAGVRPSVLAEVDDMAMLRLLAREAPAPALTLVPPVVVRDELRDGLLVEHHRIAGLAETFYAIVPDRRYPHPLVREILRELPRTLPAPRRSRRPAAAG